MYNVCLYGPFSVSVFPVGKLNLPKFTYLPRLNWEQVLPEFCLKKTFWIPSSLCPDQCRETVCALTTLNIFSQSSIIMTTNSRGPPLWTVQHAVGLKHLGLFSMLCAFLISFISLWHYPKMLKFMVTFSFLLSFISDGTNIIIGCQADRNILSKINKMRVRCKFKIAMS